MPHTSTAVISDILRSIVSVMLSSLVYPIMVLASVPLELGVRYAMWAFTAGTVGVFDASASWYWCIETWRDYLNDLANSLRAATPHASMVIVWIIAWLLPIIVARTTAAVGGRLWLYWKLPISRSDDLRGALGMSWWRKPFGFLCQIFLIGIVAFMADRCFKFPTPPKSLDPQDNMQFSAWLWVFGVLYWSVTDVWHHAVSYEASRLSQRLCRCGYSLGHLATCPECGRKSEFNPQRN